MGIFPSNLIANLIFHMLLTQEISEAWLKQTSSSHDFAHGIHGDWIDKTSDNMILFSYRSPGAEDTSRKHIQNPCEVTDEMK